MNAVNYSEEIIIFPLRISFLLPPKQVDEQNACSCCFVVRTKLVKAFLYLSPYWKLAFVCDPVWGEGVLKSPLFF